MTCRKGRSLPRHAHHDQQRLPWRRPRLAHVGKGPPTFPITGLRHRPSAHHIRLGQAHRGRLCRIMLGVAVPALGVVTLTRFPILAETFQPAWHRGHGVMGTNRARTGRTRMTLALDMVIDMVIDDVIQRGDLSQVRRPPHRDEHTHGQQQSLPARRRAIDCDLAHAPTDPCAHGASHPDLL